MRTIYIAGPYTLGDVAVNVRTALDAAEACLAAGLAPYVPHLSHFWHLVYPHPAETWLALDAVWLAHCGAVLRLPGVSRGADLECAQAYARGIPVFFVLADALAWGQEKTLTAQDPIVPW